MDDLELRPVVTIAPDLPLDKVAGEMRAHDISALVVGRPGELISIVTERDLTQALADGRSTTTAVRAIASPQPVVVAPDESAVDAAAVMLRYGVRHLVVARGGRAVGVLSMRRVLAALVGAVTPDTRVLFLEHLRFDRPEP